jgi:hypothetical protein
VDLRGGCEGGMSLQRRAKEKSRRFTVPEVWRKIVKKNDRQGTRRYDILICDHAVPANDNTYRKARACPECRIKVQQYADSVAARQDLGAPAAASP